MSARIERIAAARADAARRRIAAAADAVPGVAAEAMAGGVVLSGVRLRRRWLADERLRGVVR